MLTVDNFNDKNKKAATILKIAGVIWMKLGKFKNWCIKEINNNFYIYSWSYRSKAYRTSRRNQRYYWRYRGKYGSTSVYKFLKSLPKYEQSKIHLEYERLKKHSDKMLEAIQKRLREEPFKSEKENIMKIRNSNQRRYANKELIRQIKKTLNQ